jgi:hypothetical protein
VSPIEILNPSGGAGPPNPKNLIVGGGSLSVATIEIPGLSGSPDIIVPAGAGNSQYNDEFDQNAAGTPTGWTSFGTPGTLNTSDVPSALHIATASSANAICGVYKAITLTYPAKITLKILDDLFGTNFQLAGMLISPVAPGNAGTGYGVCLAAGLNGQNFSVNMSTLAYTGIANGGGLPLPCWLQLQQSSALAVASFQSRSGFLYQGWSSNGSTPTGTAYVCVFVNAQGAANGANAFFDYIRFS